MRRYEPDWRDARAVQTMHQWRKLAEPRWLSAHENILQARAHGRLVIISRPGRKRLQLEIACTSRDLSRKLIEEFGGHAEKWPRDWIKRFADLHKPKPLKIGKRLLISTTASSPVKRGAFHRVGGSRRLALCNPSPNEGSFIVFATQDDTQRAI